MYVLKIFLLVTVLAYAQTAVLDPVQTLDGLELTDPFKALSRNRRQDADILPMATEQQPQARFLGGLLQKVPGFLIGIISKVFKMIVGLITGNRGRSDYRAY
ncbi:unnamed protein product [Ceutorhynchus assimilis]|uniref:Uncharacterized protein n=1 Tax=Ceutorhynchus assimilis TaxID=467358 RepID=A0A9N9QK83_9CUCU|nr:unnamed protein product [Ceutorhynchus assimilis]